MESRIDDVQSLCNKRRGSLQRRVNPNHRPVQAVQPKPLSSSMSPDITPKSSDSQQQSATDEDHRKWRPSFKARVCVRHVSLV